MTPARIKYPRTFHLPWSLTASSDDKRHSGDEVVAMFAGHEVVVTEKMDGENFTIYSDGYCHARSLDSAHHKSRSWVKALAAQISHAIPEGWRICGENLYAIHSIEYDRLSSYFLVFAIYDENNTCLSWDDTVVWASLLGLHTVPVLYRGEWSEDIVKDSWNGQGTFGALSEGYVVRVSGSFCYKDFSRSCGKFVRANHVQTDRHWMNSALLPNKLA